MKTELNNSITIPKQLYVGFRRQGSDDLPLGFATPYDTSKAYEKRKSTVDYWSNRDNSMWNTKTKVYDKVTPLEPTIIDNVPLSGFKIAESVRRVYWGGGNVVWRIVDPHGYELEISSANLAKILDCSSVVNGEIMGECVWGRDKAQNVLLPVSSKPYLDAVNNTSRAGKKVPLKEVTIGDTVVLNDGTTGVYAGAFNGVLPSSESDNLPGGYRYNINMVNIKRKYVLLVTLTGNEKDFWSYSSNYDNQPGYQIGDVVFMFYNELHISLVTNKTTEPKNFLPEIRKSISSIAGRYCAPDVKYITDKPIKPTDFVYTPIECSCGELEQIFTTESTNPRKSDTYIATSGSRETERLVYFRHGFDIGGWLLPIVWDTTNTRMTYVVHNQDAYYGYGHRPPNQNSVVPTKEIIDNNHIMRVAYQINGEVYIP